MSFRTRLALASALAVAVAVVAASGAAYLLVRDTLRDEVDRSLVGQVERRGAGGPFALRPPRFGGPSGYAQIVTAAGRTMRPGGAEEALPVSAAALAVARGERQFSLDDARVDGVHLRVLTTSLGAGSALQVARPLDEVDATLSRLRLVLLGVGGAGIALAALLGVAVSRTAIGPLRRLAVEAEAVADTADLTRRVRIGGGDEVGRLGTQFDRMLAALEESQTAQRQLVADASHELRTPIATVRTNLDLLERHPELPVNERDAAVAAARAQLEELSELVTDIVELARDGEPDSLREPFRLDEVVADAVARARAASPGLVFTLEAEPAVVEGVPTRVHRAVSNLLDNASKWSPPGGVIEVAVRDHEVTVRDHGPGVDAGDRDHVFDRFWRAPAARSRPGSGLGLAIVKQTAELHGGRAMVEDAPGGGALFRLQLLRTA